MRFAKYAVAAVALLAAIILSAAYLLPPEQTEFVNETLVFENRLSIPPLLSPRIDGDVRVFDLGIRAGETEFFPGKRARTIGLNGSYLGPTLRARTGDKVRIEVANGLGETATVHWHGMHLPAAMDGGPHQTIAPGTTWRPDWTVTNEAATLWYHSHMIGKTGEQVYRGLAGLFIIDDANSDSLGLPDDYGVDDLPLIVQDRKFDADGQLVYDHVHAEDLGLLDNPTGMLGDTILVNGTRAPFVEVPATLIRLRLLNASNARRYNFGFAGEHKFQQIASDGGFLDRPVERTRVVLAPGERAEILVDLSDAAGPLTLMSYAVVDDVSAIINLLQRVLAPDNDEDQEFRILELRPAPGNKPAAAIPARLNSVARLKESDAVKTRRFSLEFTGTTINGKTMDHARIDEIVRKGDVEIWEVTNDAIAYHPFHVHGVQFQILARNGREPPAHEQGWKDTVIVGAEETVRLIMRFTTYSDPHLPYMFHCHILEHEDMGMMGQFVVVDDLSDEVSVRSPLTGASDHSGH